MKDICTKLLNTLSHYEVYEYLETVTTKRIWGSALIPILYVEEMNKIFLIQTVIFCMLFRKICGHLKIKFHLKIRTRFAYECVT